MWEDDVIYNDADIEMFELEQRANSLVQLGCGCTYDSDYDETWATCPKHQPQARYVGGAVEYVIDGRPE